MKKFLCCILAATMTAGLMACGKSVDAPVSHVEIPAETRWDQEEYTFREAVALLSDNWNPHTCQSADENYPNQFLSKGLYSLVFNDSLHPVQGMEPYSGYTVIPEMAAKLPRDITREFRQSHKEFKLPAGAQEGYVYVIALNPNAQWENGKIITADTYVESMKRLLEPDLQNAGAAEMYSGEFVVAGAEDYVNQGRSIMLSLQNLLQKTEHQDMQTLIGAVGSQPGFLNWYHVFGSRYDFAHYPWTAGQPVDMDGFCLEAENTEAKTPLTVSQLMDFLAQCFAGSMEAEELRTLQQTAVCTTYSYPEAVDFSQVGVIASDEYELTLVLQRPLTGFRLLYSLTVSWLVEPELYDSCIHEENGLRWSSYGTSLETTLSCGPYTMESFVPGKSMRFTRNDTWYGYSDELHKYEDPRDHLIYRMYQTDVVETLVLENSVTQKNQFLQGKLTTYGLQPQDFSQYRNSEFCYADPSEMVLFLILNGKLDVLQQREQAENFDRENRDLETITLRSFRKAISASIDKEVFAATLSPARTGAYGIVGEPYICDPATGTRYRDTDQAKEVLCRFYGVNPANYGGDLDEAAASIVGYDTQAARELFFQAFEEALGAGFITDADQDGISDQQVTLEYCVDAESDFKEGILNFLNQEILNVTRGTPFEGKVRFVMSQPYGNNWYEVFCSGRSDLVLAGWTGSLMNPFALTELYTDGESQYDGAWFDASLVPLTLNIRMDGEEQKLTLSLRQWSEALNGTDVKSGDQIYNFGDLRASEDVRLTILAGIEEKILESYNYIPMLQDASMHLMSRQAAYVVEKYHPVMARGGLPYLKYRYSDQQWQEYLDEIGGQLKY